MRISRFLCFTLLFIGIQYNFAQIKPIYVAAPNGLSLREEPNKDSKRIELLSYGTKITNYTYESKNGYETIDGYYGTWVKVSMPHGKTGYIFDGYTLPIQPPISGTFQEYLTMILGTPLYTDSIINDVDTDGYRKVYINHYKYGVIIQEANMYEAYESSIMNLAMSMDKLYLWYYLIEENLWGKMHLITKINYPSKNFKSDTLNILVNQPGLNISKNDGSFSYLKIFYQNGGITITWGSYI